VAVVGQLALGCDWSGFVSHVIDVVESDREEVTRIVVSRVVTRVVGHGKVRRMLEHSLPAVSLLIGPLNVGKRTLARHVMNYYQVISADRYIVDKLTADEARNIGQFVRIAPYSVRRVVVINLDDASEAALNIMLKILEEPPSTAHFILVSSHAPLATIASRAHIFRCGLLRSSQVTDILVSLGLSPHEAHVVAVASNGRVILREFDEFESARARVLGVLKSIADHDTELFSRSCNLFTEVARILLIQWLHEAITGRWSMFSEVESFGLTQQPKIVRRMILALSPLASARAKLAVRVALEPLLTERG